MQDVVQWLKDNGNLKIIDEPLDVELEIPHIAYVEVKTDNSRPIQSVDRKNLCQAL